MQDFATEENNWRTIAESLFFVEHFGINDIALILQKSRQSISVHINSCEAYEDEMRFRKSVTAEQRKEYQRNWDRENRSDRYTEVNGYSMKREHDVAVAILSKENY